MQRVLVTGSSRGIGLELCRHFLAQGERVIATCRQPDKADLLGELAVNPNLQILALEVADPASVDRLVASLNGSVVDVLVNNAGIMGGEHQSMEDMDYLAWQEAFEVNTMAPFRLTTALLDNLLLAERPRVVTLSSQMGALHRQSTGAFAYRSSKAAVNKVMQVLALELQSRGVAVCPVHPGWVRTDMGGDGADISVEECVSGLATFINGMSMEHSGRFWTWEGKEHPW